MAEVSASPRYLLGESPVEIRYLVEQTEAYAREASDLLNLIGVRAGSAAIDVGCGVMGILHLLTERIGPAGRVVGLDRAPASLAAGRRLAAARGLKVDFTAADATATGLPSASIDLAHARTLLLNVSNRREILAE